MARDSDYIGQVINYIKKNLKKGYTKESLTWALINQGHSKFEITRAFQRAEEELAHSAPILKTKPVIKHEFIDHETEAPIEVESKQSFWKRLFG